MQSVDHFGLHEAPGGIHFLHQQEGGWNAANLRIPSPFVIQAHRRKCPHRFPKHPRPLSFPLRDWFAQEKEQHPLLEWLLPLPKPTHEDAMWIETEFCPTPIPTLGHLLRLSCPTSPQMHFIDYVSEAQVDTWLTTTNLGPVILLGIQAKHTAKVARLRQLSALRPRRLGFVGEDYHPHRNITRLWLPQVPERFSSSDFETLGAHIIHARMRNQFHGWFDQAYA